MSQLFEHDRVPVTRVIIDHCVSGCRVIFIGPGGRSIGLLSGGTYNAAKAVALRWVCQGARLIDKVGGPQ